MGSSESTGRSNVTEEEERQRETSNSRGGSTAAGAAVTIAAGGLAAWGVSRMISGSTDTESSEKEEISVWSRPPSGRYKMNTDGGFRKIYQNGRVKRKTGYGGILRDHRGIWVRGFQGFIDGEEPERILIAELLAIHRGLVLLEKHGYRECIFECDNQEAVILVNGHDGVYNKQEDVKKWWHIVERSREIVHNTKNKIKLKRIAGKYGNQCADKLANMPIKEEEEEYTDYGKHDRPDEITDLYHQDLQKSSGGGSTAAGAAVAIATVGLAAWGISRMISGSTDTESNEKDEPMKMKAHEVGSSQPGFLIKESGRQCEAKAMISNWSRPPSGWYKMNTDGGFRKIYQNGGGWQKVTGYGGILRNDRGEWVRGFQGFMFIDGKEPERILIAELLAIHRGLVLLEKHGYRKCIFECDNKEAVNLVNGHDGVDNKQEDVQEWWDIVERSRELVRKTKIKPIVIHGKYGNQCADKLANMPIKEHEEKYMDYGKRDRPDEITQVYNQDLKSSGEIADPDLVVF